MNFGGSRVLQPLTHAQDEVRTTIYAWICTQARPRSETSRAPFHYASSPGDSSCDLASRLPTGELEDHGGFQS